MFLFSNYIIEDVVHDDTSLNGLRIEQLYSSMYVLCYSEFIVLYIVNYLVDY